MLNLDNLNKELLSKFAETSDTMLFVIKNDMSIIDFSPNFQIHSKKFKNIYELITYTHRSEFFVKLNQCIKEQSIVSFKTNFSYDNTDVEDIPNTFNITMQFLQNDKIILVAETVCMFSHDNAKGYFSMMNDYSAISRRLQKSEYNLDKKNLKLKETIKELLLKEEMMLSQSKQAAMGEMIAMIAHQWRQPLSAMNMDVNSLTASIAFEEEITTDNLLSLASNLSTQIQQLSKTIDDFRNFFKPKPQNEYITIEDALNSTLNIIGMSLVNNNISLNIQNNSKSSLFINKSSLIQILLNIIGNAKEMLLEKKVPEATVNININETKETIIISICDNGGGIPESIINKIGQPYFTTKKKLNGTGLGLHISKTIVEKHFFGTLLWHNEKEGACFVITFNIEQKT